MMTKTHTSKRTIFDKRKLNSKKSNTTANPSNTTFHPLGILKRGQNLEEILPTRIEMTVIDLKEDHHCQKQKAGAKEKAKRQEERQNGELIGRPLIPFFDPNQENQINEKHENLFNMEKEELNLDARFWHPDGYFVYPEEEEEQMMEKKRKREKSNRSNRPKVLNNNGERKRLHTKEEKKKNRRQQKEKSPNTSSEDSKSPTQRQKWALSAFQRSPDPTTLPIPTDFNPSLMEEELEDDLLFNDVFTPIEMKIDKRQPPKSMGMIEQTMTKDLCRLLNIGQSL